MPAYWRKGLLGMALVFGLAAPVGAETVADIQAELNLLNGQVEQLRNELVRQGSTRGLPTQPATALTRLDQLQDELKRLTNRVDVLSNDISRITQDATNRVGDIEFRLTELEGGDTALVAKPEPLGGGLTPMPRPSAPAAVPGPAASAGAPQLTVTEKSDFDVAVAAAAAGDNAKAAQLFGAFLATYPGGPLSSEAQYRRGEAQAAQSDWRGAARSFLDAFSGAPEGTLAAKSLYHLGVSLGELGQTQEACLTLIEVDSRYPGSEVAGDVAARKRDLGCE
ncbi:tetratricopeptide repeat protein [uncultured Amaricoccus sp.]|uniref:tetratricopeptide repeat protein n=1 Tax=uncultured Amaricoccus sp. TaxID=339341 RepID=UPI00262BCCC6|nr:tetratricopeptide repeat protein [uncultured Amaricoccus sp.]